MGISSLNKLITDDWQLISTSSPSAQSTITISSISPIYSKLLLTLDVTNSSSSVSVGLTINNSSTGYMSLGYMGFVNSTAGFQTVVNKTSHLISHCSIYNQTAHYGLITIDSANTLGGKYIKSFGSASGGTSGTTVVSDGFWDGSAAIDRLDIAGPSMTGTIKLYGVRL